jgi:hypothetical protein
MLGGLGFTTTVAVAWACALLIRLPGSPTGDHSASCPWRAPESTIEGRLYTDACERFGSARYSSMLKQTEEYWPDVSPLRTHDEVRALLPGWSRGPLLDWVDQQKNWPPGPFVVQGADARGWPFHALWCAYAWSSETEPDLWYWMPHGGGIELGDGLMPVHEADWCPRAALPCLPICGGLIGDTAFYTGAWWVLLRAPRWVRGQQRRRLGRCAKCAYDRRGLSDTAPCPECGERGVLTRG